METVVEVEVNAVPESEVSERSSPQKSLKLIADPVVYQLVRVEGDGRLVPATDEEVSEVEDLLDDGKNVQLLEDTGKDVECPPNNICSSDTTHLKESQSVLHSENLEASSEKAGEVYNLESHSMKPNTQIEDVVPSLAPSTTGSHILSETGECSNTQVGVTKSETLNSLKPNFSKLKGEICLNNLSVRELHEIFRALFGRITTNKDKQWLKRRISMGLTKSCDVSSTNFIIEDNGVVVVNKSKEEKSEIVDVKHLKDPIIGAVNEIGEDPSSAPKFEVESHLNGSAKRMLNADVVFDQDKEDILTEQRAAKRVRKPTRRYIEEVSDGESRETSGKLTSKAMPVHCHSSPRPKIQPVESSRSDGRSLVTRQDSLGGSGIQIPYVSRVRRGRPRENYMTFMLASKPEKGEECLERITTEFVKDEAQLEQHTDLSGDYSDDGIATVPTPNGGMRRKHHRPWTLSEVVKLVEGVARYGAGRWSEIKRVFFASHSHRTSVDLKDKWRNLLRASFAQSPNNKGVDSSRKHASIPIPAPLLVRVRELAELQAQVPPYLGGVKFARHSGRSVHERQSGYL